jgi:death-on-curing protein
VEVRFLSVLDVQRLHHDLLEPLGQASVLRDTGLLEGAVMRPRHAAYYEDADIFEQAAKLACGIALAHAFEDGNKRLAYVAAIVFLAYNGVTLNADPVALADQVLALVNRQESLDAAEGAFATYLRGHTTHRES